MADILSKKRRSAVMSSIKSRGNKATEQKLIAILHRYRIVGWRRNQKIVGNPDFVFKRQKLAIFVDGCFWHGCPKHCRKPSSNIEYWHLKILRNRKRDIMVRKKLQQAGWIVS